MGSVALSRAWCLVLALLIPAASPQLALGQTAVVLEGDAAPGTGGGTFLRFHSPLIDDPSINSSGDLAFRADVLGGSVDHAIFVRSGGVNSVVARPGDPAPGGGTYETLRSPRINDVGDVVFSSMVEIIVDDEPVLISGIFIDSAGTQTAVARSGDPAPGTAGGTYTGLAWPRINSAGDVAFIGNLSGGNATSGFFVDSGGTQTAAALEGDPAPGTGGGTYSHFIAEDFAASHLAFLAFVAGGTVTAGIFLDSAGADSAVALLGDPAPGGAGPYSNFGGPSVNVSGDVAFKGFVPAFPVGSTGGIFVHSVGENRLVGLEPDPAPGTGGGAFGSFFGPRINAAGDVAFRASVFGGATADEGIFLDTAGTISAIVLEGDSAPGTGGGTYGDGVPNANTYSEPILSDAGTLVFGALIEGGMVEQAIYTVPEPDALLQLAAGLAFLALLARLRGPAPNGRETAFVHAVAKRAARSAAHPERPKTAAEASASRAVSA